MAERKKGYLFSHILKSKILKEPLFLLVSFVLRIQTILSLIRDTTLLKFRDKGYYPFENQG